MQYKNRECPAYDEATEIVRKIIGHTAEGPIWKEEKLLVSQYCSMQNTYDFDCANCPFYEAFKRGKDVKKP